MKDFNWDLNPFPVLDHEPRPLRTLPLYTCSAADARRLLHQPRLQIDRRAEYVRAYLANQRESCNRFPKSRTSESELDPVLRHHLGLDQAR